MTNNSPLLGADELGWHELDNGALLNAAATTFEVFVTTDQNLKHQQNLAGKRLAILILPTMSWPALQGRLAEVLSAGTQFNRANTGN